jgi:putative redox protein
MKVEVKMADGLTLLAKGESKHWIVLDGSEEFGGHEAATKPMELLLISLAGCTAMDVISLLNKMRVNFKDLRVKVEAKQKDEHPKVFTSIDLEYIIYGNDLKGEKIEKAINKSQEKYCPVTAMLKENVPIKYSYKVIPVNNNL